MSRKIERRNPDPNPDDELSPEILALLESCGGEIRESDRAALAVRRATPGRAAETDRPAEARADGEASKRASR